MWAHSLPPDTGWHCLVSELSQPVTPEASTQDPLLRGAWNVFMNRVAVLPVPLSLESLSSFSSLSNVLLEDEMLEAEQLSLSFTSSFRLSFSLREDRSSGSCSTSISGSTQAVATSWLVSCATCSTSASGSSSVSCSGAGSLVLAGGNNGDYNHNRNFLELSSEVWEWIWGWLLYAVCVRQNSTDGPQDSDPLVIHSNTNLGTAGKELYSWPSSLKSVDLKNMEITQVRLNQLGEPFKSRVFSD